MRLQGSKSSWRLAPRVVLAVYLFTVVGTARCAVRAAFSGASTCPGQRGTRSVPPAALGRARRSAASLPTNYVRTVNRYLAVAIAALAIHFFIGTTTALAAETENA